MQLTWRREPGGDWILLHKRRRMGRVVPDSKYPGMYRIALPSGRLSDMANLSWAKSLALDAAERGLAYEAANTPQKPQQKRGSFRSKSSPIRSNQSGVKSSPIRSNQSGVSQPQQETL